MRLIILENIFEARNSIKILGRELLLSKNTVVLSLDPKVEVFLKGQDVPCQNTIEYFPKESHEKIVLKTQEVVEAFLARIDLKDRLGLAKTYKHFFGYHLRFYLNFFYLYTEILNNVCQRYSIQEVFYQEYKSRIEKQGYLTTDEHLLMEVVVKFCRQRGLTQKPWKSVEIDIFNFNNVTAGIAQLMVKLYFKIYFMCVKKHLHKLRCMVVSTWGYKFEDIIREVQRKYPHAQTIMVMADQPHWKRQIRWVFMTLAGILPFFNKFRLVNFVIPIQFISESNSKKDLDFYQGLSKIQKNNFADLNNTMTYHGLDFSGIIFTKIELGLKNEMKQLHHNLSVLFDLFSLLDVRVVMSPFSTGFYYGMGELSKVMNIESCAITHGTHVPPNNKYEDIENRWLAQGVVFNEFKRVALQTPWMKKFMDYYNDDRPFLVTGPLAFAQRRNSFSKTALKRTLLGESVQDKKVLLYATTQKTMHCNRFYITETLDEFVSSLGDIVKIVNSLSELHLVIRPHPICDLTIEDFKLLLPKSNSFSVVSGGKFEDILTVSDLLLSYSSTCIEEALANNMPVVLYDKWKRYNHFNIPESNGRSKISDHPVSYITNFEYLRNYLHEFDQYKGQLHFLEEQISPYRYSWEQNKNFYDYVGACLNGGKQ